MQDQDRTREQLIEELNEMSSSKIELEPTNTKPQAPKPKVPDHENPSPEIEVLISSKVRDNPYHPGEKASLNTGLYCETVMSTRERLLIPNALKDQNWDHNPDIPLGMICYLGYPLLWPDDDIFGTICILDNKENSYSVQIDQYVKLFRGNIENYLALLFEVNEHKPT